MNNKKLVAAFDAIIQHLLSEGNNQVTSSFTLKGEDEDYHMKLTCLLDVEAVTEGKIN